MSESVHVPDQERLVGGLAVSDVDAEEDVPFVSKKLVKQLAHKKSVKHLFSRIVKHVTGASNEKRRCMTQSNTDFAISATDACIAETVLLGDVLPGVVGLRNHGNTCFMNAVLQCLGHTEILVKYFVLDMYKQDLVRRNKWNSKKYGTHGELTEHLAMLLKSVWTCQYNPEISSQFKSVIDKYGSQYRGSNQHDAQEFLMWLLDKVHEDLNTASKKKYKTLKNLYGKPDEVVAAETLANHLRCNNSFVHDLFQAQFRSSLTCPNCQSQSNTFDPFLCVSTPVPQRQLCHVFITVTYLSQQPRQVKLGLNLNQHADIKELREMLSSDTGINEKQILLTEIDGAGFHRTFSDIQPVYTMQNNESIYCIEMPELKEPSDLDGAFILLCWINVTVHEDTITKFGSPYAIQICRETCYKDLQKLLLKEMFGAVDDAALLCQDSDTEFFRMRISDDTNDQPVYLDSKVDHPLYTEAVDNAFAQCDEDSGPPHVKLILEWSADVKEKIIIDDTEKIEDHVSVGDLKNNPPESSPVTLRECLELYTRAEKLGPEDAWHCPFCNRKQEVVKKLGLWSLPDILVVHLKRFRQLGKQRVTTKLTTMVDFPVEGFDMSPHVSRSAPQSGSGQNHLHIPNSNSLNLTSNSWSPWKRQKSNTLKPEDYVYDLYAVCNHHGQDLQGGHYTAICRVPVNGHWYCFDDTKVYKVDQSQVKTSSAYILFYQRRTLHLGSTDNCNHWANRLSSFRRVSPKSSKSQENLISTLANTESTVQRGVSKYCSLKVRQSKSASEELHWCSHNEAPIVEPNCGEEPYTIDEPETHNNEKKSTNSEVHLPDNCITKCPAPMAESSV